MRILKLVKNLPKYNQIDNNIIFINNQVQNIDQISRLDKIFYYTYVF